MLKRSETDELIDTAGRTPFFGPTPSVDQLAAQQGVKPIENLDDLAGASGRKRKATRSS